MSQLKILFLFGLGLGSVLALHAEQPAAALDRAFEAFWQAADPDAQAAAIHAVLDSGATFEQVWARLAAGRPYSGRVKTGRVDLVNRTSDRVLHHYRVAVPRSYDPDKRYPARFYLHGGVSRPAWHKGGAWWSNYAQFEDPRWISVFPSAWRESMWWQRRQAENLPAILDHLKRVYNLDENAVHLLGISDGSTGVYFFAFRVATPWASFLPFLGHPAVLANRRLGIEGQMYARNLLDRPFFIVTGDRDRLYPSARMPPYLDLLRRAGAAVEYHPQPTAGHDTSWYPAESENIRAFIAAHRRDPLPERLAWETERTDRYQRNRWLLITELGPAAGDTAFDDLNTLGPPAEGWAAFPHRQPSGRVELVRDDNVIRVRSQGVRAYRLLLSPEELDFDRPLTVFTNGRQSWQGRLERDARTLLEWAARDNDRTMLFGAELEIRLPPRDG